MSATLNLVGLATLLVMSATLLANAGIPVDSMAHAAFSYFTGVLPVHLP